MIFAVPCRKGAPRAVKRALIELRTGAEASTGRERRFQMTVSTKILKAVLPALCMQLSHAGMAHAQFEDVNSRAFTVCNCPDGVVSRAFTVSNRPDSVISRAFTVSNGRDSVVSRAFSVSNRRDSVNSRAFTAVNSDNQPPVCDAGGPYAAECQGPTTAILLDGSGSSDPDAGDTLTFSWTSTCPSASFDDPTSPTPTLTIDSSLLCPSGITCEIQLVVDDGNSASDTCSLALSFVDTTPPVLTVDTTPITLTDSDCSGDETVTLPIATATDVCAPNVSVTNDAPATLPAGQKTTVTFSAIDVCGNTSRATVDVTVLYGADILVTAAKHTLGMGSHPGSIKEPLVGIEVCAYDKSDGSCARQQDQQGDGISWQEYADISTNCAPVNCATTDANGVAVINLPPGDYIVISHFDSDGDNALDQFMGVSASNLLCGELKKKHLQLLQDANGNKKPGKTTRLTGSELLIIEPEYVVWDNTQQLYPFVFETVGDWDVTASASPPDGFVSDYNSLSADVNNAIQSVQFTITEIGSDLVPTETTFQVTHNGRSQTVRSSVGITLTPKYARSRGFNVAELRARGLIMDRPGNQGHGPPHDR